MHNNYFFLQWLVREINPMFSGGIIREIYSQDKDVLILRIIKDKELFIRAHLKGDFSCLSFPESQSRAKRNSIDLFTGLIGMKIQEVKMTPFDRSFQFVLENDYDLLFKLHGHRSNIILLKSDSAHSVFKHSLKRDAGLVIQDVIRSFPTLESFDEGSDDVRRILPVLDAGLAEILERQGWEKLDSKGRFAMLKEFVEIWEECDKVWLRLEEDVALSLLEVPDGRIFNNPVEALNIFHSSYLRNYGFSKRKQSLQTMLRQRLKKAHSYLKKTEVQLKKVENQGSPSEQADLIMAHLHLFKDGSREVEITSFDGTETVLIKLKGNSTAIQHAENLYRKSKNKKIEIDMITGNLEGRRKELELLQVDLVALEEVSDIKEFDKIQNKWQKTTEVKEASEFHEFEFDGFTIRVGRNAKNNDKLTFGNGYKEDLWLHVKDARGSHVLLKYRSDRKFSKIAIEKAAQLAAYYSKRKTEGMVPVIYTPKKFVRKRKGDPAGMVVVDKEQVLLVEPENMG